VARSRRERRRQTQRLILDSGAVIALARHEQPARAFVARALELGAEVEVPVVVVAETVRGGPRDAPVHRVLKAIGSVPDTREAHGRTAGRLLGTAQSNATVDALVVAQAVEAGGARILTGDPEDLERMARPHSEVSIQKL
jgi:predicted nucleic acid-binding protein